MSIQGSINQALGIGAIALGATGLGLDIKDARELKTMDKALYKANENISNDLHKATTEFKEKTIPENPETDLPKFKEALKKLIKDLDRLTQRRGLLKTQRDTLLTRLASRNPEKYLEKLDYSIKNDQNFELADQNLRDSVADYVNEVARYLASTLTALKRMVNARRTKLGGRK